MLKWEEKDFNRKRILPRKIQCIEIVYIGTLIGTLCYVKIKVAIVTVVVVEAVVPVVSMKCQQ